MSWDLWVIGWVQDLVVRQYKVTSSEDSAHAPVQEPIVPQHETTPVERLIQQLKTWKRDTINDQSNVGTWLMGSVHRYTDIFQLNGEKGRLRFGYSITKNEFIGLIENGTIAFEPEELEFLEVLIKKDNTQ